jgi:hypothetical protein
VLAPDTVKLETELAHTDAAGEATVNAGTEFVRIVIGVEDTQPSGLVPLTLNKLLLVAVKTEVGVLIPLLQVYVVAPLAVNVLGEKAQVVNEDGFTAITGKLNVVIATVALAGQPFGPKPVTTKIVLLTGATRATELVELLSQV